jgi:hypothetical protein
MKKFTVLVGIVGLIGIVAANMAASASWFNQPKRSSMLVK